MKRSIAGIFAAATVAFSTSTAMADGIDKASRWTNPRIGNWTGLYIGGAVGYGIASTELDVSALGVGTIFNLDGISSTGVQGTAAVGYDAQVGRHFVLGVFGDFSFGDIETTASIPPAAIALDAHLDHAWSLGARLGVAGSCCTLWYVNGGYTQTNLEFTVTSAGAPVATGEKTLDGYFVGVGVEQQLDQSFSLKLEYRFADYGRERLAEFGTGAVDTETDVHSVRLGANWKFNLFRDRNATGPLK